eukprot:644449-Pelagomonas_calceolata.AAC.4
MPELHCTPCLLHPGCQPSSWCCKAGPPNSFHRAGALLIGKLHYKAWVETVCLPAKEALRASEEPLPLWRGPVWSSCVTPSITFLARSNASYECKGRAMHAQQHQPKLGSSLGSFSKAPGAIEDDAISAASCSALGAASAITSALERLGTNATVTRWALLFILG